MEKFRVGSQSSRWVVVLKKNEVFVTEEKLLGGNKLLLIQDTEVVIYYNWLANSLEIQAAV